MIIIEQVTMRTDDIEAQLAFFAQLGHAQWVRDTVDALHLFKHPEHQAALGDGYRVHLAFNYEVMGQDVTFALEQRVSGYTWNIPYPWAGHPQRISSFDYHTLNQREHGIDTLFMELQMLQEMGMRVMQVSQTVAHKNTDRRYRIAYLTGNLIGGVPLKVVQRLLPKGPFTELSHGREVFACL